ncbi:MAG: hypothetical protein J6S89_10060, partial [Paludibacteraceae bacterium]|nr:hypothetical protein [Paludibacteraceae bacterium]
DPFLNAGNILQERKRVFELFEFDNFIAVKQTSQTSYLFNSKLSTNQQYPPNPKTLCLYKIPQKF